MPLGAAATNGDVSSNWIHLALAIDNTNAKVYLNGLLIPDTDMGFAMDPAPTPGNDFAMRWAWATDPNDNIAYPSPFTLNPPLEGFGMSGIADNTDYYNEVELEGGAHYFQAIDIYGDGWQGGWFQVFMGTCDSNSPNDSTGNVLVGAPSLVHRQSPPQGDLPGMLGEICLCFRGTTTASLYQGVSAGIGAPEGEGGVYAFVLPDGDGGGPSTVCVHLHTGDWASEYDWNFDGNSETAMVAIPAASILIGGRNGWSSFMGGIAAVSVHGNQMTELDADCLFNFGSSYVAICPDVSRSSYGQRWVVFNGTLNDDATLMGDAYMDSDMGVSLDGDGDYIEVRGDTATQYSHDGTFSISLWATRGECNTPGSYEMLYGHQESKSRWSGNWVDPDNTNIHILLGCGEQGTSSTIPGDVIRTLLVDDDGSRVAFDWPLGDIADNGNVNTLWMHLILSVSATAVRTFVDSVEITSYGYPMGGQSWNRDTYAFAQTSANLAYPDGPSKLNAPLVGFGISKYADDEDYYFPITLGSGDHVFHAVDTFGDGWQGGYFEVLDGNGAPIVGGAGVGLVATGEMEDFSFNVPRGGGMAAYTVHISTGDWANELMWSIDAGIVTDPATDETSGYGGPTSDSPIQVGGQGYGGFQGQLGGVSIVGHAVQGNEARCLYESGAQFVGMCPNYGSSWRSSWLVVRFSIDFRCFATVFGPFYDCLATDLVLF